MTKLLLSLLALFFTVNAPAFELKRVILSTNNNPTYIQFWPVVAPVWSAMGLRPTLALIADEDCPIDTSLGDVIRFDPIPGVPESLQAQTVRLLLPALFPDDACLISDMEMIPVSREYFTDGAAQCPDESFLVYRDKAYEPYNPRYPMCYVAGLGKVFGAIFNIHEKSDIAKTIESWTEYGFGWDTDELLLYMRVKQWEQKGGSVVYLGHGVGPRIDRLWWPHDTSTMDASRYIDCHCLRPYETYKKTIDEVVQAIYRSWGQ